MLLIDRHSYREARDPRLTISTSGIVPTTSALPKTIQLPNEWIGMNENKTKYKSVTVKIVCTKRVELTVLVIKMLLDFNGAATMNTAHNTINPNDLEKIVIWEWTKSRRWWWGRRRRRCKAKKKIENWMRWKFAYLSFCAIGQCCPSTQDNTHTCGLGQRHAISM